MKMYPATSARIIAEENIIYSAKQNISFQIKMQVFRLAFFICDAETETVY